MRVRAGVRARDGREHVYKRALAEPIYAANLCLSLHEFAPSRAHHGLLRILEDSAQAVGLDAG